MHVGAGGGVGVRQMWFVVPRVECAVSTNQSCTCFWEQRFWD